jgi:cytochrome c
MSASDCGAEAAHAGHCRKLELGAPSPGLYSALPDFTRTGADPNQLTRCEPSASLRLPSPLGCADGLDVHANADHDMHHMKPSPTKAILVLVTVLASSSRALAAGDPAAGQRVFATHCATCHATEVGQNKIGPSLAGIVGSKSGTVPGFNFSAGMKNADITWDDAELDKFLANPAGDVHGTKMFVNLPSESDRQNVIAYLHTLKK